MKKFFLSFSVIALFSVFAAFQKGGPFEVLATNDKPPLTTNVNTVPINQTAQSDLVTKEELGVKPATQTITQTTNTKPVAKPTTTTPAPAPVSKPVTPTPTPVVVTPKSIYKDGTFTGAAADAYYGNIQVAVTINSGKISDVVFLQYPNDRNTSVKINTRAMPLFKAEAIQAQSANVNGVSGATDSSIAFQESLAYALALAKN